MFVFVLNCGSSSFKYQLLDMRDERRVAIGLVERNREVQKQYTLTVLAELAEIREAIRRESGEFPEELILNDRAEREEELWQRMGGSE